MGVMEVGCGGGREGGARLPGQTLALSSMDRLGNQVLGFEFLRKAAPPATAPSVPVSTQGYTQQILQDLVELPPTEARCMAV
jgi:hypothetical protein